MGFLSEISIRPREIRRLTGIERTAGARESALHSLMLAQASVPTLLGLFCDVNATVLAPPEPATGTLRISENATGPDRADGAGRLSGVTVAGVSSLAEAARGQ